LALYTKLNFTGFVKIVKVSPGAWFGVWIVQRNVTRLIR
jgi:SPX domain protein involved in polyphosphate accumulation